MAHRAAFSRRTFILCASVPVAVLVFLLIGARRTFADIILVPDATYTSNTNKLLIAGTSPLSSLTDGTQTVRFSSPLLVTTFIPWGTPPNVEAADPGNVLLQLRAAPVTLTLSSPVRTFGFEFANNALGAIPVTATFRLGTTVVETDERMLPNNGGALLFAVTEPTAIDNVVISAPDASIGFGIAQLRYSANQLIIIPEPSSLLLAGLGIVCLMGNQLPGVNVRRRKSIGP